MTRSEFNVWVKRHQALFPKLTDWLGDQEQPGVILDAWASAMATCVAAHAADATDRMLRGVAPLVEFNDWASLPAVVIAHCRPLGSGRQERTGDGNYVSGAAAGALQALQKAFCDMAPGGDRDVLRDFEALVEVMDSADLLDTKNRILDAVDDGSLGAQSGGDLLTIALKRSGAVRFGNPGTPRFASAANTAKAGQA